MFTSFTRNPATSQHRQSFPHFGRSGIEVHAHASSCQSCRQIRQISQIRVLDMFVSALVNPPCNIYTVNSHSRINSSTETETVVSTPNDHTSLKIARLRQADRCRLVGPVWSLAVGKHLSGCMPARLAAARGQPHADARETVWREPLWILVPEIFHTLLSSIQIGSRSCF